jgi:alkyl hydroperoxide reductase subunit AhpC
MIADVDYNVSSLRNADSVADDPADRTPADNRTVRNVFVIGPDKKVSWCSCIR